MGGIVILFLAATMAAASPVPSPSPSPARNMPTWDDEIAQGHLPYHQLSVEDFSVRDSGKKQNAFFIKPFVDPRYEYYLFFNRGWVHAYIKQWQVFSGVDRNETFRDPRFHEMKAYLPYAQAILDLNELYARKLSVVPPEGFPESRAGTEREALAGLQEKINSLCQRVYAEAERETDAFVKATRNGEDKEKTRKLAAEISQRLKAMPAPTPFGASPAPAPSVSPASSPASTPPSKPGRN